MNSKLNIKSSRKKKICPSGKESLSVGFIIPARQPSSSNAFFVISKTITGIGSGFLFIPMLVSIQSFVNHDDMPITTAMI